MDKKASPIKVFEAEPLGGTRRRKRIYKLWKDQIEDIINTLGILSPAHGMQR